MLSPLNSWQSSSKTANRAKHWACILICTSGGRFHKPIVTYDQFAGQRATYKRQGAAYQNQRRAIHRTGS